MQLILHTKHKILTPVLYIKDKTGLKKLEFQLAPWISSSLILLALGKSQFTFLLFSIYR